MRRTFALACLALAAIAHGGEAIKVVVLTGGHGYPKAPFEELFKSLEGIEATQAPQKDHSELFEDIDAWDYDVIVFYNMSKKITEKRQANFLKLLDKGVGVVALHHSMANYADWPEFGKIIGGKYYFQAKEEYGAPQKKSGYKHDVDMNVQVVDKDHPVTKGLEDFKLHDETYSDYLVLPDSHVLLKTDHPTSTPAVTWCRTYAKSRVVCIQMGHGAETYGDASYRKLLTQAIAWTAGR